MAVLSFKSGTDNEFVKLIRSSQERKAKASAWLSAYQDDQVEELGRLITERWKSTDDFRLFFINIVRKLTDRKATVYKIAPKRTFEGWDQEKGEELYRDLRANIVLKRANRLTKLLKTNLLQVLWIDGQIKLGIVTPNVVDVIHEGDPESPRRIIVSHPGKQESETTYSDWTVNGFAMRNWRGHEISNSGNNANVNPYGHLPFVPVFDRYPDAEFFLPGGDDIIEAQRAINVSLANIWRATELQAHGQPWVSGVNLMSTTGLEYNTNNIGPTRLIRLPDGGKFGFETPNAPIEDMLKAIEFVIKQTAVANDLAANVFELDAKAESGAAKHAEQRDLIEARQDDIELWRNYEAQLFGTLKAVINTHEPGAIPDNAELRVDFGEVQETLSDIERLEGYQRRMDMGLWSRVDALMSDNPDIRTREDALEILQTRNQEASVLGSTFQGPTL